MAEDPLDYVADAVRLLGGLLAAVLLALAFAVASVMALAGGAAPGFPVVSARPDTIPPDQRAAIETASDLCGIPWQILAGMAKVESQFGRDMAAGPDTGAGYLHARPAVWAGYAAGASAADAFDYRTASAALARFLCAHGAPGDLRGAIRAYRPAPWYADDVFAAALRYGYLAPGAASARVVDVARAQLGVPYVWGGASPSGFDCSGLVQWSYARVGVALPRTAQAQYDATARVATGDLRPGDLVFFAHTYPSLDRITHVGLYIGQGLMINAPTTGDVVRVLPAFTGYWGDHYAGAGRVGG